jgi:alpha-tubulin suppressor-like RCC1 family protein
MRKLLLVFGFVGIMLSLVACQKDDVYQVEFITSRLAGGPGYSLVINEHGQLYGMGTQMFGVLANGVSSNTTLAPTLLNPYFALENAEIFVSVKSGYAHAFALTSKNRLFAWGWNLAGQTGTNLNDEMILTPVDITEAFNLSENERISQIQTGNHHTILLTSFGRVFAWGENTFHQVGTQLYDEVRGGIPFVKSPVEITNFFHLDEQDRIIYIGTNQALTLHQHLYAWGIYAITQTGDRSSEILDISYTLEAIEELGNVTKLLGAGDFILSNHGKVYQLTWIQSFGLNAGLILGFDQVAIDNGTLLTTLFSSNYHIVLVKQGVDIIAFGKNTDGNLGNGNQEDVNEYQSTALQNGIFSKIYDSFQWDIPWQDGETVLEVFLSENHTLVLTTHQRLFGWGSNQNGELGDVLGQLTYLPQLITLPE